MGSSRIPGQLLRKLARFAARRSTALGQQLDVIAEILGENLHVEVIFAD
jgi:hypothetical protein